MIPRPGIWTGVKDRLRRRPSCSGAQLSNLIQFKKGENQQRGERRREGKKKKKSLLPKKKLQIPYIIHRVKLYSHYLLFVLYTSWVIWRPNRRRLKTGNEKGETSQLLKRYLQNKDHIEKKAKQQMSREKHLGKANKNLKKLISLGSLSLAESLKVGQIDNIAVLQQVLKTRPTLTTQYKHLRLKRRYWVIGIKLYPRSSA